MLGRENAMYSGLERDDDDNDDDDGVMISLEYISVFAEEFGRVRIGSIHSARFRTTPVRVRNNERNLIMPCSMLATSRDIL